MRSVSTCCSLSIWLHNSVRHHWKKRLIVVWKALSGLKSSPSWENPLCGKGKQKSYMQLHTKSQTKTCRPSHQYNWQLIMKGPKASWRCKAGTRHYLEIPSALMPEARCLAHHCFSSCTTHWSIEYHPPCVPHCTTSLWVKSQTAPP